MGIDGLSKITEVTDNLGNSAMDFNRGKECDHLPDKRIDRLTEFPLPWSIDGQDPRPTGGPEFPLPWSIDGPDPRPTGGPEFPLPWPIGGPELRPIDGHSGSPSFDPRESYLPIEGNNGSWDGERGESVWCPDRDWVPLKSNPEGKTWGEILDEYGIDGIPFKDGEPDFSEVSKGEVKIEPFSTERSDNFDKADAELAKQRGCTPEEVAQWRKENGYTWHECNDMGTMQKVPSEVHNNVPHSGGISEAKKKEGES